jgi:hypothetical protein
MAFLRFTRDKRGYEHFSLVEATTNRRGKSRTRLLYWYRTPPNVRVGREPFDESVRRALETQNPNVQFDWRKIVETPIPSAETERWRERRRAEKAEKAGRRDAFDDDRRAESPRVREVDAGDAAEEAASETEVEGASESEEEITAELAPAAPALSAIGESDDSERQPGRESAPANTGSEPRRRRRRRRGRRGSHGREAHADGQTGSADTQETPAPLAPGAVAGDEAKPDPEGE